MEDEKHMDVVKDEENTPDTNSTITFNHFHKIYGEDVFNNAFNPVEDSSSLL